MTKLKFSINLAASPEQLLKAGADFENYPHYLPDQLKSVKIIGRDVNETITEEIFVLSTILKKEIKQKSRHKISDNKLIIEVISGPAKGTIVNILYNKIHSGAEVNIDLDLKLDLKYKLFVPLIKKLYKVILTGIFYKMNTTALEIQMS